MNKIASKSKHSKKHEDFIFCHPRCCFRQVSKRRFVQVAVMSPVQNNTSIFFSYIVLHFFRNLFIIL